MKNYLLILLLLLINTQLIANHFPTTPPNTPGFPLYPVTSIQAHTIYEGDEIFIGYSQTRNPCLTKVPNLDGDTEFIQIDGNNNIDITISGSASFICLDLDMFLEFYQFYSLGELPVGTYNIQMYWTRPSLPFPTPPGNTRLPLGENIQFEVLAPIVIPLFNLYSLITLGGILMFVSFLYLRKRPKIILLSIVSLLIFSGSLSAKKFHLILSTNIGTPTAQNIVNQATTSPSPPAWILSSFNTSSPSSVDYLITDRPFDGGNLDTLLTNNPTWSLARLYQMLIVFYPDSVDENTILANFANDTNIDKAAYVTDEDFISGLPVTSTTKSLNKEIKANQGVGTSFLSDLNINSAWELSEGMGYIVALDLGVQKDHPDIQAFNSSGNYVGGNLLDAFAQIDFGSGDLNVDAKEPTDTCVDVNGSCTNPFHASLEACDLEDGVNDDLASIGFIGHGTHITGIMVGKNNSIGGVCKNCGMSVFKTSFFKFCTFYNGVNRLFPVSPDLSVKNALRTAAQIGNGTINLSGGSPNPDGNFCDDDGTGLCLAVDFIKEQNTLLVAAAGNDRRNMNFPASEVGVVAVGGLSENLKFWNESPNNGNIFDFSFKNDCPRFPRLDECGSNVSQSAINRKIDVSTQARTVFSTFYFGEEWADDIGCTDFQDGAIDGYGNCTGTSMSTPQVASIIQLMRSTHPLLPNGTFDPALTTGLINVLNASATHSDATISPGQNNFYGYGLPDARVAIEKILGKSNGVQIKTRLTPMFNIVSTGANNNVYTPFPQVAMAFLFTDVSSYSPDTSKPLVNEFTQFWYAETLTFPPPRAEFYVFTTNNNPFTGIKNMTPLRRMGKTVSGNRNDTYAVSDAEIQSFHDYGYNLAGIEGYILPITQCNPIPCTDATALYRDESDSLNHKLVPTNSAPPNSVLLGYVYLNQDADGDGLIDGQEILLGTNINVQDTDGDTTPDGVEYPPAGVPVSDPRISDVIYKNGFE